MRRLLLLAGMVAALVVGAVPPAWADPAVPTSYRSEVVALDPPATQIRLEVVGGDAFLWLWVEEGHEALVLGYEGEPYLRIDPSGLVWQNAYSPATYLNDDRYARVELPAAADAAAEPQWEEVGSGGSWAWHDHRIHWMSPETPPQVAGGRPEEVFTWELLLMMDGEPVAARGRLVWMPSASPFPALAVGLVGLTPLALWRRRPRLALGLALVSGAAVALAVGWGQWTATPPGARPLPLAVVLPALALAVGVAALLFSRPVPETADTLTFVGGMALLAWVGTRLSTLWMPVLLSPSPALERMGMAWVIWAGLAAAGLGAAIKAKVIPRS